MKAPFIEGESYEEWRARSEALNASHMTDPPTQQIGLDLGEDVEYPDRATVEWVCCGPLKVFYEEGNYRTFARCTTCGKQADIHKG